MVDMENADIEETEAKEPQIDPMERALKELQRQIDDLKAEKAVLADERAEAPVPPERGLIPAPQAQQAALTMPLSELEAMANKVVLSKLFQERFKSASDALAVMLTGREMGLPPMMAVNSLYSHKGRTASDAKTMLAVVYKSGLLENIDIKEEPEANRCTVTVKRKEMSPYTYTWDDKDSKTAGLLQKGGGMYKKYPREMRKWRCVMAVLRVAFPDVIGGLYGWQEFGDEAPYSTARSGGDIIEGEVREIDGPPTTWLDYERRGRSELGLGAREPFIKIGVTNVPQAQETFGSPEAAWEKLVVAVKGVDKVAAVKEILMDIYEDDIPEEALAYALERAEDEDFKPEMLFEEIMEEGKLRW